MIVNSKMKHKPNSLQHSQDKEAFMQESHQQNNEFIYLLTEIDIEIKKTTQNFEKIFNLLYRCINQLDQTEFQTLLNDKRIELLIDAVTKIIEYCFQSSKREKLTEMMRLIHPQALKWKNEISVLKALISFYYSLSNPVLLETAGTEEDYLNALQFLNTAWQLSGDLSSKEQESFKSHRDKRFQDIEVAFIEHLRNKLIQAIKEKHSNALHIADQESLEQFLQAFKQLKQTALVLVQNGYVNAPELLRMVYIFNKGFAKQLNTNEVEKAINEIQQLHQSNPSTRHEKVSNQRRYQEMLHQAREQFYTGIDKQDFIAPDDMLCLQKQLSQAYKTLVSTIMADAEKALAPFSRLLWDEISFVLLLLGSISFGSAVPLSDVEYTVLLKKKLSEQQFKLYMQPLIQLFQFKVASLGETPFSEFPGLLPIGLRLDRGTNVLANKELMATEDDLINYIKKHCAKPSKLDPGAGEEALAYSLLHPDFAYGSQPLYENYLTKLHALAQDKTIVATDDLTFHQLNAICQLRQNVIDLQSHITSQLNQEQCPDFKINLKSQYIKPLFILIAGLSFYYSSAENKALLHPLEQLNAMHMDNLFNPSFLNYVKISYCLLQKYRINLHRFYQTGIDEICFKKNLNSQTYQPMTNKLIPIDNLVGITRHLDRISTLVLYPLYAYFKQLMDDNFTGNKAIANIAARLNALKALDPALAQPKLQFNEDSQAIHFVYTSAQLHSLVMTLVYRKCSEVEHFQYYNKLNYEQRQVYQTILTTIMQAPASKKLIEYLENNQKISSSNINKSLLAQQSIFSVRRNSQFTQQIPNLEAKIINITIWLDNAAKQYCPNNLEEYNYEGYAVRIHVYQSQFFKEQSPKLFGNLDIVLLIFDTSDKASVSRMEKLANKIFLQASYPIPLLLISISDDQKLKLNVKYTEIYTPCSREIKNFIEGVVKNAPIIALHLCEAGIYQGNRNKLYLENKVIKSPPGFSLQGDTFNFKAVGVSFDVEKSDHIHRYIYNKYTFAPIPIGVSFNSKRIAFSNVKFYTQLWDLPVNSRLSSLRPLYYRGTICVLIFASLENLYNFKKTIEMYKAEILKELPKEVALIAIGMRSDISDRVIDYNKARAIAKQYDIDAYFEFSAVSGLGIEEAFDGAFEVAIAKSGFWKWLGKPHIYSEHVAKAILNSSLLFTAQPVVTDDLVMNTESSMLERKSP